MFTAIGNPTNQFLKDSHNPVQFQSGLQTTMVKGVGMKSDRLSLGLESTSDASVTLRKFTYSLLCLSFLTYEMEMTVVPTAQRAFEDGMA